MPIEKKYVSDSGTWSNVISNSPSDSRPPSVAPSGGTSSTPEPKSILGDNKVSTEVTRDYVQSESNILSGQLEMREAKPKLKAKKTIALEGVGGTLSGLYYVESVKNVFSNSGYEQSLTVTRKGFGSTSKKGNVQTPQPPKAQSPRVPEVTKGTAYHRNSTDMKY